MLQKQCKGITKKQYANFFYGKFITEWINFKSNCRRFLIYRQLGVVV